jgi:hypothetical protein
VVKKGFFALPHQQRAKKTDGDRAIAPIDFIEDSLKNELARRVHCGGFARVLCALHKLGRHGRSGNSGPLMQQLTQ